MMVRLRIALRVSRFSTVIRESIDYNYTQLTLETVRLAQSLFNKSSKLTGRFTFIAKVLIGVIFFAAVLGHRIVVSCELCISI